VILGAKTGVYRAGRGGGRGGRQLRRDLRAQLVAPTSSAARPFSAFVGGLFFTSASSPLRVELARSHRRAGGRASRRSPRCCPGSRAGDAAAAIAGSKAVDSDKLGQLLLGMLSFGLARSPWACGASSRGTSMTATSAAAGSGRSPPRSLRAGALLMTRGEPDRKPD
jgi:hypothetical protein